MKSSKPPIQAAPVVRTILTVSVKQYTQANGVIPSIMAPTECSMGGNSSLCQMWRSGRIMF